MIIDTLTSPVILFFVLGFIAAALKSDLSIPEAFAKAMSIYLMAAIGLKGGVEVANRGVTAEVAAAALAGLALSFLLPVLAFALLRQFGGLSSSRRVRPLCLYLPVMATFITGWSDPILLTPLCIPDTRSHPS